MCDDLVLSPFQGFVCHQCESYKINISLTIIIVSRYQNSFMASQIFVNLVQNQLNMSQDLHHTLSYPFHHSSGQCSVFYELSTCQWIKCKVCDIQMCNNVYTFVLKLTFNW